MSASPPSKANTVQAPSSCWPTTGEKASRVASSSYMRTTDGRAPIESARRTASTPAPMSGKRTVAKRRSAGSGTISSVTCVITPSVPSEPTNSCVSSGPTAWRGTSTVSITSPPASATRMLRTRSSILP